MTESSIQSSSSSHTHLPQSSSSSHTHLPQSSSSSHTHLPQNSSSRYRHSCVEIPPKTRYKQKQNETHYENITHNINIYDKTALSQQNSDLRC
jgi:hypothetical protein